MKRLKQSLSIFLAFIFLFSSFPGMKIDVEAKEVSTRASASSKPRPGGEASAWEEADFTIKGTTFTGLSRQGKEKLEAYKGAGIDIPSVKNRNGDPVTSIGYKAFEKLGITSVKISNQITEIDSKAFRKNYITSLVIPNSVKKIGSDAFEENDITSLQLSENCAKLEDSVFKGNKLEEVIIPDCVTEIVDAFRKNPGSRNYGRKVVLHIADVSKIKFTKGSKDDYHIVKKAATSFEEQDFIFKERAKAEEGMSCLGLSEQGKEKAKRNHQLNIPAMVDGKKVETIEKGAFRSLNFKGVTLPETVKIIKDGAFAGNALSEIDLPRGLNTIEQNAFCYNELKTLYIPNAVKSIGLTAFAGNKLGEVKIDNREGDIVIDSLAFDNQTDAIPKIIYLQAAKAHKITIKQPEGATVVTTPAKEAREGEKVTISYNITDSTKEFLDLKVKKSEYSKVEVVNNTFTMPGTDVTVELRIKDKYTAEKWHAEDFVFAWEDLDFDNLEEPAYYCVEGFTEKGLKKLEHLKAVVLPESDIEGRKPTWVWDNAFKGKQMESLTVPGNYTHIQNNAFKSCGLTSLKLSEGLVYVNDSAFEENKLQSIVFPKTFKYPSKAAFKGNQLKVVALPDTCESIGPESFMDNQIETLTLGKKTGRIWSKAFANNRLQEVNIPNTLKNDKIAKDVFDGNTGKENPLKAGEKKVLLWTPKKDNPNRIQPGNHFVVDPVVLSKEDLEFNAEDFKYHDGKVEDFSKEGLAKFKRLGSDSVVKLPAFDKNNKPVTGVGEYAFSEVQPEIKKIDIPEGYVSIGEQAFSSSKITEVELPNTMSSVHEYAFLNYEQTVVKLYVSSVDIKNRIGEDQTFWTIVVKENNQQPTSTWTAEDFTYDTLRLTIAERSNETVALNAVSGFSKKGLEKLSKVKNLSLPTRDSEGRVVEAVMKSALQNTPLGAQRIKHLEIPEGYKYIGAMAFAFNGIEGDVTLPDSLEGIGEAVFFRNNITAITFPKNITEIPESFMRGNKLSKVLFKGDIESIARLAFAENRLEEITVPDSLKTIGDQAFTTNIGSDAYGSKVVIRTKLGKNIQKLKDTASYIVDPKAGGSVPSINYQEWTVDDFAYANDTVTGFSDQGLKKIRKNKHLVIPDKTPDGKALKVIGIDAFRNLNKGFDIESVIIPDTVVEIEDYALQFNDIEEVTLPRDLKKLGMGVFMDSHTKKVVFNENLEYIGHACFFDCPLGKIELPAELHTIELSAFRKCRLTEVSFKAPSKLKIIGNMAFGDNALENMTFPEGIERIGEQAFGNNQFTAITLPKSIKEVGFQAFVHNPDDQSPKPVVITTESTSITDDIGKTFVVNPDIKADTKDKSDLEKALQIAKTVEQDKLTVDFRGYFKGVIAEVEEALKDEATSKTRIKALIKEITFVNKRSMISALIFEKESLDSKASTFDREKWKQVEAAYKKAKAKLMVINLSDEAVSVFGASVVDVTGDTVI